MGIFDSSSTSVNSPWKDAQPYIRRGMATAGGLLKHRRGFNAPGFQTFVPMSRQTRAGLNSQWAQARRPNPLAGQSEAAVGGILSGDVNQRYKDLYANSDNAHFDQNVQNQSNHIADDVQRQFSGLGRVGSAADTGALVNQIGEYRTKAMSDNWNQNIANQRGILGDQVQGQLGAVAAAPGAYDQRFLPGRAMGQVGAAYDDFAKAKLQSRVDRFNTNQNSGWNRLGAYNAGISGNTQGTGQTTTSTPFNWAGAAAGLGLGAASAATKGWWNL